VLEFRNLLPYHLGRKRKAHSNTRKDTHEHKEVSEDTTPTFKLCTFLAETLFQLHHELHTLEKWVKEQPCQTGAENKP
jgi:hypothetical protein